MYSNNVSHRWNKSLLGNIKLIKIIKTAPKTKLKYTNQGTRWIIYWDLQLQPFLVLQWHQHNRRQPRIYMSVICMYTFQYVVISTKPLGDDKEAYLCLDMISISLHKAIKCVCCIEGAYGGRQQKQGSCLCWYKKGQVRCALEMHRLAKWHAPIGD